MIPLPRPRTAALALAGALALAALTGCAEDEPRAEDPAPVDSSTSPSATTEPTQPAASTAPPTESDGAVGETTVPLYFVADAPQGQRLFREFRKVPADNPLAEAAALVLAGDALDPDYGTLWPAGELGDVFLDEEQDRLVVSLPEGSPLSGRGGLDKAEARLAVQQLVLTLQGVAQTRAPLVARTGDDATPSTLLGVDTADGVANADQLEVLGLVNVTSPEQGATVSGTFTASGVASSFEATVPWEVRDSAGKVVADGFSTAEGWMDKLYPWKAEVDVSGLAPGDYTFVAMTSDPSGGEEGFGPTEDTKAITVR